MIYTPYRLVTGVMHKLGVAAPPKILKRFLGSAKMLLERMRKAGYDDVTIDQMIDYTCNGMLRDGMPRTFSYFYSVMTSYLEREVNANTLSNVVEPAVVPNNEKGVDN